MKIKGSALRSTMNYLREHFSPDQVEKVMQALPSDARAILEIPILVSSWYEADLLFVLMKKMVSELNQSPDILFPKMGEQSCDDGMNTVYRIFFKIGSPGYILKFTIQVWSNYYSEGKMILVSRTSNSAHLRLEEVHFPDRAMCLRITGWLRRALELTGAKVTSFSHSACIFEKAPACEWKATWA